MNTANDLTINKLRLNNAVENSSALRVKLSRWMESLQVRPSNISPSTVLIVRKLVDPLPNRLDLSLSSMRIDSTWERAVQNKLSEVYRQAARPGLGSVSANAVAVAFSDEAEMFACLTLDLIRSEASGHWWWRTFLRSLPYSTTDNITKLLCDRPTLVPAILHHLAERGHVETVVAGLSPEQALRIMAAVNRAYALSDLPRAKHEWPSPTRASPEVVNDSLSPETNPFDNEKTKQEQKSAFESHIARYRLDAEMPWDHWLPSGFVPAHLPKEKACLLGVGLTLHCAPAAARSESFLQKLHAWWLAPSLPPSPKAEASIVNPLPSTTQRHIPDESTFAPDSPQDPIEHLSHEYPPDKINVHLFEESELSPIDEPVVGLTTSPDTKTSSPQASSNDADLSDNVQQPDLKKSPLLFEGGVDTQLGGVFYLINLMAQLNLPQCFEDDCGLASQLGAWGVLDILARALLDDPDEALCHDPLWQALAELDGRETDELPGATFQGSGRFNLPAAWPGYVGDNADGTYAWGMDGNRCRLWSGQGYVLAEDVNVNPLAVFSKYFNDAPENLSQQPYDKAPIAKLTNSLLSGLNPDLRHWLAVVMPYVRLRLQQALRGELDLNALLLLAGQIYLTSTHVDLCLSLKNVSIPIRMAGLDLDPSWLPDFGRIVLFHYE